MSYRPATLILLGLGTALLGCGDVQDSEGHGRERSPVTGGVVSDSAHDGVVEVFTSDHLCSGALIAPNVVLTALHCLTARYVDAQGHVQSQDSFTCDTNGNAVQGGDLGALRPASDFTIYTGIGPDPTPRATGQQLFSTGSMNSCKWDLGLIVLDQDVDEPLIPLRLGQPTSPGEETIVIGYGEISSDGKVVGRQERAPVDVLYVGADIWNPKGSQFASPDTIVVGEGPCHGDSGGPLLSLATGAAIGVSSVGYSSCGGTGVQSAYTEIASFEKTIRDALDAGGHEPVLEQTGSGGDAGATGQAGEAGAFGEGGATTGSGGGVALGGSGGSGSGRAGKGGSSGSAGQAGGTGASAGTATSTGGTDALDGGSGSRRDPACTCRAAGSERSSRSPAALLMGALALALRRRARAA